MEQKQNARGAASGNAHGAGNALGADSATAHDAVAGNFYIDGCYTGKDDNAYQANFAHCFQYFQSRCQHHIHKLVNGKRIIPNACRSKTRQNECKHGAPWTDQVSPEWMTQPLLICKGLAKRFNLRRSGSRNWLGQMLTLRNDEWLNGTMPGLCVAFAGSNSDVKPNDRLPITSATHDVRCRKHCVKKLQLKRSLRKSAREIQRIQTLILGYFGGYIGKRQPAGAMQTRKCVDKLFTLRSKWAGHSKKS